MLVEFVDVFAGLEPSSLMIIVLKNKASIFSWLFAFDFSFLWPATAFEISFDTV